MLVSRIAAIPRRGRCHLRRLQVSIFRSARKCCGNFAGKEVTRNFFSHRRKNGKFCVSSNTIVVTEKCVSAGEILDVAGTLFTSANLRKAGNDWNFVIIAATGATLAGPFCHPIPLPPPFPYCIRS